MMMMISAGRSLATDSSCLCVFWFHLQAIHRCRRAAVVIGSVQGGATSMRHAAAVAAAAAAARPILLLLQLTPAAYTSSNAMMHD